MNDNLSIGHKKIYFPNLDSIRTIAFLLVFVPHCFQTFPLDNKYTTLQWLVDASTFVSNMGVNLFFVLSGFLITYLLLIEQETTGKIHLKEFYIRRILRIWPVYYLAVISGFIIIFLLFKLLPLKDLTWDGIAHYLFFLVNFEHINYGLSHKLISVLWSVSVEEQFYLFWPVLLILCPRKHYVLLFIILILGSLGFIVYQNPNDYRVIHYHTLSVAVYLVTGSMGAWLSRNSGIFMQYIKSASRLFWVVLYLLIIALPILWLNISHNGLLNMFKALLFSWLFLLVILEQNFAENSLFKLGRFRFLNQNGKYTYGLYSLHFFGIFSVYTITTRFIKIPSDNIPLFLLQWVVAALVSYALAWASYNYYEKFFLKFKSRFDMLQDKQKKDHSK